MVVERFSQFAFYGDNHPLVATNYNNVGGLYKVQGDYAQALEYYRKALAIYQSVYGENHPDVAVSYNNIGNVCYHQGQYAQALECFQKAFAILKAALGEDHPDTQFLKECVEITQGKMQDN